MVTESRETGSNTTDIYQIIGLYNDESGGDDGLLHLTVEQIELHSFLQQVPKIGMVDMVFFVFQPHEILFFIGILIDVYTDKVAVPVLYNAADAPGVDFQSLLEGTVDMRDEYIDFMRYSLFKHGGDEEGEGTGIIFQVFARKRFLRIAVSAHGLDGNLVCHLDATGLTEIIHLGKKVTESLFGILHSFVATEDERIVHHLVASLRFQVGERQEFPYPLEKFCGTDIVLIHELLLNLERCLLHLFPRKCDYWLFLFPLW